MTELEALQRIAYELRVLSSCAMVLVFIASAVTWRWWFK